MRLNKRMRATIRDVPLFEVVRYVYLSWCLLNELTTRQL